jgi:hypothetical protein
MCARAHTHTHMHTHTHTHTRLRVHQVAPPLQLGEAVDGARQRDAPVHLQAAHPAAPCACAAPCEHRRLQRGELSAGPGWAAKGTFSSGVSGTMMYWSSDGCWISIASSCARARAAACARACGRMRAGRAHACVRAFACLVASSSESFGCMQTVTLSGIGICPAASPSARTSLEIA